jgi:hypothetical protein
MLLRHLNLHGISVVECVCSGVTSSLLHPTKRFKTLEERSSFGRRIHDSTWKREILQRASRIRDGFVSFLEKHGLEPPPGSDEDWVEGAVVIAHSGPIF